MRPSPLFRLFLAMVALFAASHQAAAQTATEGGSPWHAGGFLDIAVVDDFDNPSNHLFRNRGTTPRVDEFDVDMAGVTAGKQASNASRWGADLTIHGGRDSGTFGFSATAPNIAGADWLRHFGPTSLSYLAPAGNGLAIQAGIFSSLIGYDSLYAKDNYSYSRAWGADYTPYLMLGVNASYPFTNNLTCTFAVVNGYWHLAHANDVPSVVGQIAVKGDDGVTFKQTVLYGPHQSNTSLEFWRLLSDSIVERKGDRFVAAFEYQLGAERVDGPGHSLALWTSAQAPLHWSLRQPWSVTFRPEVAWDRDGRWIGAPQIVTALTSTLEYRVPSRRTETIVRLEHRIDNAHGSGGGFFTDDDGRLTPTQILVSIAAIFTFDTSARPGGAK